MPHAGLLECALGLSDARLIVSLSSFLPLSLSACSLSLCCAVAVGRYFVLEFKLVEPKELSPLQELIDSMMGQDKTKLMGGAGAGAGAPSEAASSSSAAAVDGDDEACVIKNK